MRFLAIFIPLAWLALFAWVGAYEIGLVAALLSFIGFCSVFLVMRRHGLRGDWGFSTLAGVVAPLMAAILLQAWTSMFPPAPCVGDDCVTVTIQVPGAA